MGIFTTTKILTAIAGIAALSSAIATIKTSELTEANQKLIIVEQRVNILIDNEKKLKNMIQTIQKNADQKIKTLEQNIQTNQNTNQLNSRLTEIQPIQKRKSNQNQSNLENIEQKNNNSQTKQEHTEQIDTNSQTKQEHTKQIDTNPQTKQEHTEQIDTNPQTKQEHTEQIDTNQKSLQKSLQKP